MVVRRESFQLFPEVPLDKWLKEQRDALVGEIGALSTAVTDVELVEKFKKVLLEKYRVELPKLNGVTSRDRVEEKDDVKQSLLPGGRKVPQPYKRITCAIYIPFEGDPEFFRRRAQQSQQIKPYVSIGDGKIRVEIDVPLDSREGQNFNAHLIDVETLVRENIATNLRFMLPQITQYNDNLDGLISGKLETRLSQLRVLQIAEETAPFPLLERPNPPQLYQTPKEPEPIVIHSANSVFGTPHYSELAQDVYDRIIDIMSSMSRIMEYSPIAFAHLDEEQIRMHFVLMLNGHFMGRVTAESFILGHTDILISEEGLAIFVAECKIWKGAVQLKKAIAQLLGYLTWRENKTALLIFVKKEEPSYVRDKVKATLDSHANLVGIVSETKEKHLRCRLTHPKDKSKSVLVTAMIFDVRVPN